MKNVNGLFLPSGGKSRISMFAELAAPADARYRREPVAWAKEVAGLDLWSKQREIIESVRDHKKTCVKSCHQVGKSLTAATVVCWWLSTWPAGTAFAVTTAPTFNQVKNILWREIGAIHARAILPGKANQTEWKINDLPVAIGRKPSDHNQHGMQGLHAQHMLAVIDEGCGVNKMMYDAILTLVADAGGKILAIGNPDTTDGEFFEIFKPESGWNKITISAFDSPNFTGEPVPQVVRDSLIHPDWVADRAIHWGEESALYQSKCLGEFPANGDPWQIIPLAWATQCKLLEYPSGKKPVEAGIDVGGGNDRTVVVVREDNVVKAVKWFVNPDPMQTVGLVAEFLREHEVTCAKIDVIGIGWGIYGRLRELSRLNNPLSPHTVHGADVIPINVGNSPTMGNEERFLNRRAEMWWDIGREHCRLKLWDLSHIPSRLADDIIHELTMPKYELMPGTSMRIKVEPKEKIRERLHASPDLAEALLMAFVPASWVANSESAAAVVTAPSFSWGPADQFGARGW